MADEIRLHDRNLALEAVRVTERAAIASTAWMGRGDEHAADQAAVDAMRQALNVLDIEGTVVIGEGERDEAPMLYIGEKVGSGRGPKVDIALDPLEGTTITATGGPNAIACIAMAGAGGFLNAPDTYMDKIAIGGGLPDQLIDINAPPRENLANLARAKKVEIGDLVVLILDRPRHQELIANVREAGARIRLIRDGDVAGVIATSRPDSGIDIYLGIGGAPEGVLAAAALRSIGGQMQGRLHFRNDDEKVRAGRMGITDLDPDLRSPRSRPRRRDVRRDRGDRRHDARGRAPLPGRRDHGIDRHALQDRHRADRRDRALSPSQDRGGRGLRRLSRRSAAMTLPPAVERSISGRCWRWRDHDAAAALAICQRTSCRRWSAGSWPAAASPSTACRRSWRRGCAMPCPIPRICTISTSRSSAWPMPCRRASPSACSATTTSTARPRWRCSPVIYARSKAKRESTCPTGWPRATAPIPRRSSAWPRRAAGWS